MNLSRHLLTPEKILAHPERSPTQPINNKRNGRRSPGRSVPLLRGAYRSSAMCPFVRECTDLPHLNGPLFRLV